MLSYETLQKRYDNLKELHSELSDENLKLYKDNRQLLAENRYYKSIIHRLATGKELSTGQYITYTQLQAKGDYND